MRGRPGRRLVDPCSRPVLPVRPGLRDLRGRNDLSASLGSGLPEAGDVFLCGDDALYRHSAGRFRLRLAEGRPGVGLMTPDEVTEAIKSQFGDAVKASEVKGDEARMDIHREKSYEILIALKGMGFDYLNCLSAVDRIASGELEVVYNLSSLLQPTKIL